MTKEHGIKETKEVLDFAFSLHMAFEKANEDGKIDLMDAGLLVAPIMKLIPAINDIKKVKDEFKDLSSEERAELDAWIKATYDIKDDDLESKVEKALEVVISIASFVGKI